MRHVEDVLYMFAIMPPPELTNEIQEVRLAFAEKFKFVKALKPPVHITLYPPFAVKAGEATSFEQKVADIQNWADRQAPFPIELQDYDFFENPKAPVVFINVIKSVRLNKLYLDFLAEFKKYLIIEKPYATYHPHVTIGYRDTTISAFPAIKAHYSTQNFRGAFVCDKIYLWKHDGSNWQICRAFSLSGKQEQLSLF